MSAEINRIFNKTLGRGDSVKMLAALPEPTPKHLKLQLVKGRGKETIASAPRYSECHKFLPLRHLL
jgi:hypothetical protein